MSRVTSLFASMAALASLSLTAACGAPSPEDDASTGGASGNTGGTTGSGGRDAAVDPPLCEGGNCDGALSMCANSVSGWATLRRLTVREFRSLISATFPEIEGSWQSSLSPDSVSRTGFDNQSASLLVTKQLARELDSTGSSIGAAVSSRLSSLLPCSSAAADRSCAGEFVSKYGARLFRRPLESNEAEKYLTFFDSARAKTDFPTAISWITRALLHATPTLYRHELGNPNGDYRELSQYEIASALAFTFSGGPPSEQLLEKAAKNELNGPEALRAEAQALATSPAGRDAFHRFFESVFEYTHVSSVTRPKYQEFNNLRSDMVRETREFIQTVSFSETGTVENLLTDPRTFPSNGLASLYGFPSPPSEYGAVERPAGQGIGILAQGSILAGMASPEASSPTKRGVLVYEKLLCREHLEVPPGIPPLPDIQPGMQITTRQRYESLHASGGPCQECHAEFDPLGFGFEHFDEVGKHRADEAGLTIDSSGAIPNVAPQVAFNSQEELARGLAQLPEVGECLSAQLKTYVFGTEEACLGETVRPEFVVSQESFLDYWTSLAAEPHFARRRAR